MTAQANNKGAVLVKEVSSHGERVLTVFKVRSRAPFLF
jgi:hypothetical protein